MVFAGLGCGKKRRIANIALLGHQPGLGMDDEIAVGVAGQKPAFGQGGHLDKMPGQPGQIEFPGQNGPVPGRHTDGDRQPAVDRRRVRTR